MSLKELKMTLKLEIPSKYHGSFPKYHLPIEIGHFSVDGDGKICDNDSQLKYLALPNKREGLHMDLNEGFSDFIGIKEDSMTRNMILKWMVNHQDEIKKHFMNHLTSSITIDFVMFRRILKQVCCEIYQKFGITNWNILAMKHKSTIYLINLGVDENVAEEMSDKERRMCTWGFKFEQYMTSDTMNSKPNTSVPVNENEKFYTVMKGKYGDYSLLLVGEVDSVDPAHFKVPGHDPKSVLRCVELKTSKRIENEGQRRYFLRYKLIQWYLQCFLVGTPKVICGFRDDDGIVREIYSFNVRNMPNMAKGLWSAAACLNFGIQFLDFVKEIVVKDSAEAQYIIYRKTATEIVCNEVTGLEDFIPEWYLQNCTFA